MLPRDYMLFEPLSFHGEGKSGGGFTEAQSREIEARVPRGSSISHYLDLLFTESALHVRESLAAALRESVRTQKLEFSPEELATLRQRHYGEVNQWVSWEFAKLLAAIGNEEALMDAATSAPLEVTRFLAVIEITNLVAESFRERPTTGYKTRLEHCLRKVILNDNSNFIRNQPVSMVLGFQYQYPPDFIQFCAQWYHVAARRLGVDPVVKHPYVAGFLGDAERTALAPVQAKPQEYSRGSTPQSEPPRPRETRADLDRPSSAPVGPVHTHNTNEQTLKKIKIQQLLSTVLLIASIALAVFGDDFGLKAGLAGIAAALIWRFLVIPSQKWWHHG